MAWILCSTILFYFTTWVRHVFSSWLLEYSKFLLEMTLPLGPLQLAFSPLFSWSNLQAHCLIRGGCRGKQAVVKKKKKVPELNVISGKPLKLSVSRLFIYKLEVMTPVSPSCEICCEKISGQVNKKTWFSVCAAAGIWHTKWETP